MQTHALLNFDKQRCKDFFERVPELFNAHHMSESQNPSGYEELLYRIYRPYTSQLFEMIDDWLGLEKCSWRDTTKREVILFLYAIRYPDTLLLESLSDSALADPLRLSAYLHFTKHTYTIWDEDTRKGLARLGIEIPAMEVCDPFIYGAYVSSIELLKDVAPYYSFLEHDVPRQRLFQSALAAYGREGSD